MKSHVTLFSMDESSGPTFCPDDAMPGERKGEESISCY
jgi:hypothetical protein